MKPEKFLIAALSMIGLTGVTDVFAEGKCPGPVEYSEVWDASDLAQITEDMQANNSPDLKYRQCADITLPSQGFLPIGYRANGQEVSGGFKGEYLGQGFSISGHVAPTGFTGRFGLFKNLEGARISDLQIAGSTHQGVTQAGALAAMIEDATLQNITISDANISSISLDAGALAGIVMGSTIDTLSIHGTANTMGGASQVISDSELSHILLDLTRNPAATRIHFSGLADSLLRTNVDSLRVKADASESTGMEDIAGVAREIAASHLSNVLITESQFPFAGSRVGGVAVKAFAGTVIEKARVYAELEGDWLVGGIVARAEGAVIRDSLFEGTLESTETAGGIVADGSLGVLSGQIHGTTIERCSVRNSEITGAISVGGIAGILSNNFNAAVPSSITDSSAHAAINDGPLMHTELGGIVGSPDALDIHRVLFTGTVDSAAFNYSGGIIGSPAMEPSVVDGIYNSDLVPFSNGYGTPASQLDMQQEASVYAGFDLSQIWIFAAGAYPELRAIRSLRTDVNQDLVIDQQDVFAFLTLFFANSPEADFHADGVINPTDIFTFLSAWFAV